MPARPPPRATRHLVQSVEMGAKESFQDGKLIVDASAIEVLVLEDPAVARCHVVLAKPGEETRLVHVLDSFRPVCAVDGPGTGAFPGVISDASTLDVIDLVELDNVLVTMVGHVPPVDSFLTQQEGILDMTGPGAVLSPMGDKPHLVLEMAGAEGVPSGETSAAFRKAAMRVAEHLASLALRADGGASVPSQASASDGERKRFAHICEVSAFGEMFNTLLVGASVIGMLPLVVSESAMRAGAVVSADYHYAGQRNYSCFYQRNPVADAIDAAPGVELAGTILLPVGGNDLLKTRGAAYAAHLAASVGAEGAIITAVAGGNAHLDVMFAVRECEKRGIRSALSLVEMAGPDGMDPGMVDTVPEADLIISTGNREALVTLPPMRDVIGGSSLFDGPVEEGGGSPSSGNLTVPLRAIVGVNNEMGAWRLGALLS